MDANDKIIIKKVPNGGTFGDLDSRLKKINTHDVKSIVFKVDQDIVFHLEDDSKDRDQILNRVGGNVEVYLLTLENEFSEYTIYIVNRESCERVINPNLIKDIRHSDFIDVLERSNGECFHLAEAGVHYKTPSGMHTKVFLRLADAIHSFGRLDRISYWLLDELNRAKAVLIDNWSLSSIILHAQSVINKKIRFDCLHQHINTNAEDAYKVADELFNELSAGDPVFLLVSVNASGGHVSSLVDMCNRIRPDLDYISASIYQMPCDHEITRPDKIFCELDSSEMISYFESDCPYCKEGENVLQIDERYYYPRPQTESPVSLPSKYVDSGSEIRPHLDLVGCIEGALCVHRDDPNDEETPRHHAFYVDVVKLIEDERFKSVFLLKLEQLEGEMGIPEAIIYPPHNAANKLLELVCVKWGSKPIASHTLKDLNEDEEEILKSCEHICILDDVIITGGRIDRYVRAFREKVRLDSRTLQKLSVIVAVQRTENEHCISKLRDGSLSKKNGWQSGLYAAVEIYLPNWDEKSCPWCKEADMWAQVDSPFDEPSYFKSRMAALNSNAGFGITDSALPKFHPDHNSLLGSSSPLAEEGTKEIHVLFVVAVALQMMRFDDDQNIRLARTVVTNNALEVTNTILPCGEEKNIFSRYSEPLIQACLLRCAKPSEWSNEMLKFGIPKLISTLDDDGTHILLLEIMFYLKRRAYKSNLADELEKFFDLYAQDSDDPALSVLNTLRN